MIISSEIAKSILEIDPFTIEDLREEYKNDYGLDDLQYELDLKYELEVKVVYLGYLCARGLVRKINDFFKDLDAEVILEIVNTKHLYFYNGTCLTMALYWNSGNIGLDLFEILYDNGALFYKDDYGVFPWEQTSDTLWIHPITMENLGSRNGSEFLSMYNELIETYLLEYNYTTQEKMFLLVDCTDMGWTLDVNDVDNTFTSIA